MRKIAILTLCSLLAATGVVALPFASAANKSSEITKPAKVIEETTKADAQKETTANNVTTKPAEAPKAQNQTIVQETTEAQETTAAETTTAQETTEAATTANEQTSAEEVTEEMTTAEVVTNPAPAKEKTTEKATKKETTKAQETTGAPAEKIVEPTTEEHTRESQEVNLGETLICWDDAHAHDSGAINEFMPGYYITHNPGPWGETFMSLEPGDVVHVNGETITIFEVQYFIESMAISEIRDNIGYDVIGFQTCCEGGIRVAYGYSDNYKSEYASLVGDAGLPVLASVYYEYLTVADRYDEVYTEYLATTDGEDSKRKRAELETLEAEMDRLLTAMIW